MLVCCIRFIDDNGNNYNPSRATNEPYRGAYIFTGPKVNIHNKFYVQLHIYKVHINLSILDHRISKIILFLQTPGRAFIRE